MKLAEDTGIIIYSNPEERLRLMQKLSSGIATSKTLNDALLFTLEEISRAIGWTIADAWMVNQEEEKLDFAVSYCPRSKKSFCEVSSKTKLIKGQDLPGTAWEIKNSVWEEDLRKHSRSPRKQVMEETGIVAGVSLPIPVDAEVLAVMAFYSTQRVKEDSELTGFLTAIAQQLGVFLKQKVTEDDYMESEELLTGILNASLDIIAAFKAVRNENNQVIDLQYLLLNKAAEKFFQRTDLVGKCLLEEFPGIKYGGIFDWNVNVIKTGKPEEHEIHYKGDGFNHWMHLSLVKYLDGIVISGQDITEQQKANEEKNRLFDELKKLNSELEDRVRERTENLKNEIERKAEIERVLEKVNKNLEEFAHIVSHDLKAPLRSISTLAGWILADKENLLSKESTETLKLLIEQTHNMHQMITDVLTYASTGEINLPKEQINVSTLIDEVIITIQPPKNVEIKNCQNAPVVYYPKTQLKQVFQNLFDNAIKYNDKPDCKIEITCEDKTDHWQFCVKDNGPGIPKEYQKNIFKMFNTIPSADKKKDSTGIGLAVVNKVVETNGGKVWVESEPGQGAVFCFTVPRHADHASGTGVVS